MTIFQLEIDEFPVRAAPIQESSSFLISQVYPNPEVARAVPRFHFIYTYIITIYLNFYSQYRKLTLCYHNKKQQATLFKSEVLALGKEKKLLTKLLESDWLCTKSGHSKGKHCGLGPVGFPKHEPQRRRRGGFPLFMFQCCRQTLD
ncbi:hypothetical protein [Ammoniphilus resinae]|uniref:hypothetical protein n=1 Tax=Ammoniphilus resinae TaxID=861532 RepID=UPI001AE2CD1B|nr:hypothetical protein [Ammoniphilus resinae]